MNLFTIFNCSTMRWKPYC